MTRTALVVLRSLACTSAIIIYGCSGGTQDLAGGSGAGNPGGYVSVAIVADTAAGLGKLLAAGQPGQAQPDTVGPQDTGGSSGAVPADAGRRDSAAGPSPSGGADSARANTPDSTAPAASGDSGLSGSTDTANRLGGSVPMPADSARMSTAGQPAESLNDARSASPDATQTQQRPPASSRRLPLTDASGMVMTVTGALFRVRAVHLVLDAGQDPVALLDGFSQAHAYDGESIIVSGPFLFNAMTGTCEPPLDSLKAPEARYAGVALELDNTQAGSGSPSMELAGTFVYQGSTRPFIVRMPASQTLRYLLGSGTTTVSRSDTTRLRIALDARAWLRAVDIKTCLDNSQLRLNADGSLLIDGNAGSGGPCQSVEGQIRQNVIGSGRLALGAP